MFWQHVRKEPEAWIFTKQYFLMACKKRSNGRIAKSELGESLLNRPIGIRTNSTFLKIISKKILII